MRSLVGLMAERFGTVDVLVCNSGIGSSESPDRVMEILDRDWDRVLDVNLKGAMLPSKHVLPLMVRQGRGSIVFISSIRGLLGNPSLASYCASKGGEVLLAKQMALDYAREGVRVNCICPGFVLSEMLRGYIGKQDDPRRARGRIRVHVADEPDRPARGDRRRRPVLRLRRCLVRHRRRPSR